MSVELNIISNLPPPFQLGFFISFHPIVAPTLIGLGIFGLLYWFISDNLLPILFDGSLTFRSEVIIATPLGLGTVVLLFSVAAEANIFWIIVLVITVLGRIVEAGITIYGLRKIGSYILEGKQKLIKSLSSDVEGTSSNTSIKNRIFIKLLIRFVHVLTRIIIFTLIVGTSVIVVHAFYPLPIALATDWSLIIGIITILILLANTRQIREDVGIPAVIGITYCIAGAEIYEYPNKALSSEYVSIVNYIFGALAGINSTGFLGFNLAPVELLVLLINPTAYLIGVILSIVFWRWAPRPVATPFSASYRK